MSLAFGASAAEAEDVAQDTMLKLWQMRSDLLQYNSIEALVAIMARNLTVSLHRKPKGEMLSEASSLIIDAAPTPDEQLMGREAVERLKQRLRQLPPRQHAVLVMRQAEHRSYKEIGRLLGIEETSAKTLLSRARKWLLNELNKA
ncbi:MAG: sigma-70 family RNA polymerase sigma factor [Muribaculaceae bacterium]|nr:sigma-70 family RNA polymerase sigma factor [Muribaculaceae bacterium]